MFPAGTLQQWKARNTAQGTVFYPQDGNGLAVVHVRERVRPLEPIKRLAQQVAKSLAASAVQIDSMSGVEPFETREGEYGARVVLSGSSSGQKVQHTIACIFGDDFYDRVDSFFADSPRSDEYRARVGELVANYRLGLGENRTRRFHYAPPADWVGRSRGMLAQWMTHDFPQRPSQILVPAASPRTRGDGSTMSRALMARRMFRFRSDDTKVEPFVQRAGLEGRLVHRHGHFDKSRQLSLATDLITIFVTDSVYLYVVRVETAQPWLDADRALLVELAHSIRPLPRGGVDREKAANWLVVD